MTLRGRAQRGGRRKSSAEGGVGSASPSASHSTPAHKPQDHGRSSGVRGTVSGTRGLMGGGMRGYAQKERSGVRKGICTKRTNGGVGSIINMREGD